MCTVQEKFPYRDNYDVYFIMLYPSQKSPQDPNGKVKIVAPYSRRFIYEAILIETTASEALMITYSSS